MQYTVWSSKRPIGVTDLGFRYRKGGSRSGWFHPFPQSEPLMPEIVVPLIGNYFRPRRSDRHRPMRPGEMAQLAAYERACKRAARWRLQLRREDGSLVPTETVAIQDIEALLACYPDVDDDIENALDFDRELDFEEEMDFDDDPSEAWKRPSDEFDDDADLLALHQEEEDDIELFDDWQHDELREHEWTPDDDEPLPRYQIWVLLSDEAAVP